MKNLIKSLGIAAVLALSCMGHQAQPARHVFFRVELPGNIPATVSGRILIFVKKGSGDTSVDAEEFRPGASWVCGQEIQDLAPGQAVEIDADQIAFPKPFSEMPEGDYEAQAVLDTNHSYNYLGRNDGNFISDVITLKAWTPGSGPEPTLTLGRLLDAQRPPAQGKPGEIQAEDFKSPALTSFWGHPVDIKAWVVLPPTYNTNQSQKFPTVYWTHGFGGNFERIYSEAVHIRQRMVDGKMPAMIWVMMDESIPQGTHEFADSVNNGPWGTALTKEFVPYLEHKYRMDARRNGRFLNGHSSGGWATLQLQINYPQVFGGTWSTSPDPSDFHDFTGPDLYAAKANVYQRPDGTPWPIMREHGKVMATLEQFAKLEAVEGPYGGQMSSFDWVFSPKGPNGAPVPMFDRKTGAVDPQVVAYWHDHYDLAHIVESTWAERGRDLKGRIHLFVGTADTFYLDGAAHKFEAVLKRLGADAHFDYVPDRSHFDLYFVGDDHRGLYDRISREMYAVARPGSPNKHKQ
jgi:S-formylglutathione hydrolase FrmB